MSNVCSRIFFFFFPKIKFINISNTDVEVEVSVHFSPINFGSMATHKYSLETSLTMLCEWHVIFNEGFEVLSVRHHVLYRLLPQTQMTSRMSLQLISKSPEQTVPAGEHEKQKLDSRSSDCIWASESSTHTRLQAPLGVWAPEPEAGWRSWQTPLHHPPLEVCSSCLWPEPGGPPSRLSSSLIHTSCFPLWAFLTVSLTWWSCGTTPGDDAVWQLMRSDFIYHTRKTVT